ncbi:putative acetyltransferase [Novipirellula aureliae]|uniref:Putative acetyltransferase n=1 Tax=Novipirellula aureliae TaxID=2527966 RepID=A0A5C6E8R9_9BACT|nr:putative acetyltransferase [Novipirellula aureliae]
MAVLLVSPLLLTHAILSRLGSSDQSLETHSQILSMLPGTLGSYLRVGFYRHTLDHCHPTATISFGALLSKTNTRLGQHVYVGPRCMLGCVTLEDDVLLGPAVQIPSGPHMHGTSRLDVPIRKQPGIPRRVTVGRDSWIGASAIIMNNVGEQTIVGAGAVVTKPLPPRVVAAGSPAKQIRSRVE